METEATADEASAVLAVLVSAAILCPTLSRHICLTMQSKMLLAPLQREEQQELGRSTAANDIAGGTATAACHDAM